MAEQAGRVGRRIKELREERGWPKAELARRMEGLQSGNDVGRWERGQHMPRSDTLEEIARVLDTTVADLYAGPLAEREKLALTSDPLAQLDADDLPRRLDRLEELLLALRADLAEIGVELARGTDRAPTRLRRANGGRSQEAGEG